MESEHGGFMIALSQRMKRGANQVGLVFQGADPPIVRIAFPRVEPERGNDRKTTMISGDLSVCPKAVIRGRPVGVESGPSHSLRSLQLMRRIGDNGIATMRKAPRPLSEIIEARNTRRVEVWKVPRAMAI